MQPWRWVLQVLYDERTVMLTPSTMAECSKLMERMFSGECLCRLSERYWS